MYHVIAGYSREWTPKIHEFYENLVPHVQVLETMGKLKEISGYARLTLDKLPGIRADLVRLQVSWKINYTP